MKRVLILVALTVLTWVLLAFPASLFPDGPEIGLTIAAAVVCLIPALLTLIAAEVAKSKSPEVQAGVFLVGVFARMGLTVGGGAAAYYLIPLVHGNGLPFALWGLVFYLATLAAETWLVYSRLRNSTPDTGKHDGPQNGK